MPPAPETRSGQLSAGNYSVEVTRKRIRNLHLSIASADGHLRVSAPFHVSDAAILAFVISKRAWIEKHLANFQPRPDARQFEYVSGETHFIEGRACLLKLIPDAPFNRIIAREDALDLYTRPGVDLAKRRQLFEEWQRACLKARLEPLLRHWQPLLGVRAKSWAVKRMKTKWGTCSVRAGRVWFSLELAQRSGRCLEYIVVHELLHLRESGHGPAFKALLSSFLPDWPAREKELKQPPDQA